MNHNALWDTMYSKDEKVSCFFQQSIVFVLCDNRNICCIHVEVLRAKQDWSITQVHVDVLS